MTTSATASTGLGSPSTEIVSTRDQVIATQTGSSSATTATTTTTTIVTATTAPPVTTTAAATTSVSATTATLSTVTAATGTLATTPCGQPTASVPTAPTTTGSTTTVASVGSTVASPSASTLVLDGHGFGHGVGMSQWGAYGYAVHGWSAAQILGHYYPSTTIGTDPPTTVRVLVSGPDVRVRIGSQAAWRVVDGEGTSVSLPAGSRVVSAGLVVDGHRLVSPVTVAGSSPLLVGGRPYRGRLDLVSNGARVDVVDVVGMESYLDGVVGAEMPASWPAAALEAQAIAARSYALSEIDDVVTAEPFDLYGDTRSQAYGGIESESPPVSAAVAATAHQVVLYRGAVARTYYSASSGGETVSAAEAFGTPLPYLVSVADPFDTLSPFHDWGPVEIGAAAAGKALGVAGPLLSLQTVNGPSGHVETATAVSEIEQLSLSGPDVAADLGLRSSWFEVGWLSLDATQSPVAFGASVDLSGVASGLGDVELEAEVSGAGWQPVETIVPARGGSFTVALTPHQTTRYRLLAGRASGATITVTVAASVSAALSGGAVTGAVRPGLVGTAVELERQVGPSWQPVAAATTGTGGVFTIAAPTTPGTYRVGCAPVGALAAGASTLFELAA